jgi:arylsulfatase A-like enzyme
MYDFEKIQVREGVEPTEQNRRMQYGYEALISSVDDCFGRLMQKLEERGLAENTIVVYTSDHGDMLRYEGDKLFVKSRAEAESSNVPCMIRMPGGLPSGMRNDVMFGTLDFMPTLLSLMGISAPKEAEGTDLSSALRTGDAEFQDSVPMMLSASDQWRGVATRDWIYSYNPFVENPPTVERLNVLYNRKNDPSCRTNLFNDPKYADVQKRMHELTLKWQGKFEDPFMPYEKLIAETLDLSEFKEGQYIDFFKKSARGILKANPLDVSKNWARGGK